MSQRNIGRLVEEAIAGRYTRRMALKRAAALGLSAPGIAAVLAACGGAASTPTTAPSGPPAAAAGGAGTTTSVAAPATSGASAPSYANGTRGGTLRVALESDLPTMDMPFTTRNVVGAVIWCIFESLFAYDDKFQLIPMLAESDTISDDQLTHTIKLRHGVKFHNGDEMKAADVLASITRWMGRCYCVMQWYVKRRIARGSRRAGEAVSVSVPAGRRSGHPTPARPAAVPRR
jgi:peptide/nickel transport system substrate-binding protein